MKYVEQGEGGVEQGGVEHRYHRSAGSIETRYRYRYRYRCRCRYRYRY